jgi:hypothetical protein
MPKQGDHQCPKKREHVDRNRLRALSPDGTRQLDRLLAHLHGIQRGSARLYSPTLEPDPNIDIVDGEFIEHGDFEAKLNASLTDHGTLVVRDMSRNPPRVYGYALCGGTIRAVAGIEWASATCWCCGHRILLEPGVEYVDAPGLFRFDA